MAERSSITQIVQLGMEVTPGTGVAATKKLQSIDFETNPESKVDDFRPSGFKFSTVTATEQEWVTCNVKGQPTYTEIIYPLASITKQTGMGPTLQMDGLTSTLVYKWVFEPSTSGVDDPLTFTVEQGSSVRAHKFTYGIFTDFGLEFTRDKVALTGKLVGQLLQDGITLTGGTGTVALVPITAAQGTVYLDTTSAGLGTTKLGRLFSGKLNFGNRFGPFWVVDASQTSFAGTTEVVPGLTFTGIVEADAAGMTRLTDMRNNTTYFMRILFQGATLYNAGVFAGAAALKYQLQVDMAVQVKNIGSFSDQQGVYAVEFTWLGVHDATWGKAMHIEVQNKLSGL